MSLLRNQDGSRRADAVSIFATRKGSCNEERIIFCSLKPSDNSLQNRAVLANVQPAREKSQGRVPLTHPHRRSETSTWLYTVTMRRAFVRHSGHTLYGTESNRRVLPSHYQIGIAPPQGCAHFSLRQLPTRPSPTAIPTTSSTNLLLESSCRVLDTAWQDRPPSVE